MRAKPINRRRHVSAGLRGAGLNIDSNAGSVSDTAYVEGVRAESAQLSASAARTADEADALLRG